MSSIFASETTNIRRRQMASLNQLPEPGKTNSTFSVPQVAWPTTHSIANQTLVIGGLRDNTISGTTRSQDNQIAAPIPLAASHSDTPACSHSN